MPIGEWFKKQDKRLPENPTLEKRAVPDGVWEKCPGCGEPIFIKELEKNSKVCPKCDFHFPLSAYERVHYLVDASSFDELWANLCPEDPLCFVAGKSYTDSISAAKAKTGMNDALVCGRAQIDGRNVAVAAMDFRFIGGSMGSVVGEKIARITELATDEDRPLIIVSSSGGARMQEGMISLMQMAKTSAAIAHHSRRGLPYISVLAHPTSGGVTASFATLADIIIAEPNAFIGFTGPRVIEQTIKQKLPKNFQTAEFNLDHGMIDMIVNRVDMKRTISRLLDYLDVNGVVG
ncbi:MAG: acetyl-CoA carboxylase carboxyl transferase subunit beta [Candidatus Aquicultor secundus]|uniref:Acetyl-coenzyme A carboxylase carboxyl transferase subunit beta n=1 Tax=Candidatus Aquicultor secundus TaxID=1973895 RepID=A0A2M7T7Z4_9ACTN|nr:acetyl-CoA carboxylase, carboxyltransferase subunit beta [Candidatus Aquicultor secundus]NCO65689.1 acetyl-CoA carboxylase carboxyltransferase subunit beta [Solirubrobacter sp.]PIU27274.1 MAG: acetyl-CoA carboxylase carboxyl transferase subunit beta [Candidatus Aquicultor secundus]PIW21463.1 MAG: acetyl-CoA carboxylase carboxyl transferase subunit beta [Candidatus Aquicultor secundus]PIX52523.1 MAG: acetyl-CoA carboxylase carboxyl transferase subunit beta [Candidatus Aquicultor secundus]PIY